MSLYSLLNCELMQISFISLFRLNYLYSFHLLQFILLHLQPMISFTQLQILRQILLNTPLHTLHLLSRQFLQLIQLLIYQFHQISLIKLLKSISSLPSSLPHTPYTYYSSISSKFHNKPPNPVTPSSNSRFSNSIQLNDSKIFH